jgi:RNA polymerase sigma-70 factor (ECF subfamily)
LTSNTDRIRKVGVHFHRPMDEQELISRSKNGDVEAFNLLVEQYQRMAYNLALRMLGDAEAAADASQDAFLSAYRAIGKFRGGCFRSWILRITANSCHDKQRAGQRSRTVSLDNMMLGPDDITSNPGDMESPEDYALRQELGKLINEGLVRLSTDQRLVVILCDIQGLSYEEAAQVAGCSLGTVKSRLNRGRARLRDFLTQHEELLPFNFRLYKQRGDTSVSFQKGSPLPEGTGDAL